MNISERDGVDTFRERGFFVAPQFLDRAAIAALRRACDIPLRAIRASSPISGHTTPRISLLTDPHHFAEDPRALEAIALFVASGRVCALLARLGAHQIPVLKDAHYYHEQTERDWDGDWHRDSQFGRPDLETERRLVATTTSIHFRVALEDDDRLEIVPGSHARWDTPEELSIRKGAARATEAIPTPSE